jgi:DNA-binding response OmpR family regulator
MNTATTPHNPIDLGQRCRQAAAAREMAGIAVRRDSLAIRGQDRSECDPHQTRSTDLVIVLSSDAVFAKDLEWHVHRAGYAVRVAAAATEVCALTDSASLLLVLVDHRVQDWELLRTAPSLRHVLLIAVVPVGGCYGEDHCLEDLELGIDGVHELRDGYRLLVAKIGAYLRRGKGKNVRRGIYQVGAVELDDDAHEVTISGRPVTLSAKPFAILAVLMREPFKVFSRSELINCVWGPDFAISEHALDVHVHALRKQLDREQGRCCALVTIKRVGFTLKPVSSVGSARVRRGRSMSASITDSHTRPARTPRLTPRIGRVIRLGSLSDPPLKSPTNTGVASACG